MYTFDVEISVAQSGINPG